MSEDETLGIIEANAKICTSQMTVVDCFILLNKIAGCSGMKTT